MPDSFNVHSEWRGHYKRAILKAQAGPDFTTVELGLFWLWEWATCRFGADRRGDGYLGSDLLRIAHEAEWPMEPDTARAYLGHLQQAGLVTQDDDGWCLHNLLEWQPHLRKANASRENGSKGGRPAKAAPGAGKKPAQNPGEPKRTRTGQDRTGQDRTEQDIPPTPPQGGSSAPATSDVDDFAKGWHALATKHPDLKGFQVKDGQMKPLAKGVRAKIAKALAHADVRPYWRQALAILHQRGPSDWVLRSGLGWVWFLRTRAPDGGMGPAMAVVEAGEWLADKRPAGARGPAAPPARESAVERQRRLTRQLQDSHRRDSAQRAGPPGAPHLRVVDGKAVCGGE